MLLHLRASSIRANRNVVTKKFRKIASKHMIATGAGVVDADYRGPLYILLFNHSDKDFPSECPSLKEHEEGSDHFA